jgi:hypothetical protein
MVGGSIEQTRRRVTGTCKRQAVIITTRRITTHSTTSRFCALLSFIISIPSAFHRQSHVFSKCSLYVRFGIISFSFHFSFSSPSHSHSNPNYQPNTGARSARGEHRAHFESAALQHTPCSRCAHFQSLSFYSSFTLLLLSFYSVSTLSLLAIQYHRWITIMPHRASSQTHVFFTAPHTQQEAPQ